MKKTNLFIGVILGTLSIGLAQASTQEHNLSANIVYKIGSKTYNGTTSGVLSVNSSPTPTPTPEVLKSITFTIDTTNLEYDASDIATELNKESSYAKATFTSNSPTTWTITCNSGYGIVESGSTPNAPAFGDRLLLDNPIYASEIRVSPDGLINSAVTQQLLYIDNGKSSGDGATPAESSRFYIAGCTRLSQ